MKTLFLLSSLGESDEIAREMKRVVLHPVIPIEQHLPLRIDSTSRDIPLLFFRVVFSEPSITSIRGCCVMKWRGTITLYESVDWDIWMEPYLSKDQNRIYCCFFETSLLTTKHIYYESLLIGTHNNYLQFAVKVISTYQIGNNWLYHRFPPNWFDSLRFLFPTDQNTHISRRTSIRSRPLLSIKEMISGRVIHPLFTHSFTSDCFQVVYLTNRTYYRIPTVFLLFSGWSGYWPRLWSVSL